MVILTLLRKNYLQSKISFFIKTSSIVLLSYSTHRNFTFCQNFDFQQIKKTIRKELSNLKYKYSTQANYFPEIITRQQGDSYSLEFLVDQRSCDIFALFHTVLNFFETNKNDFKGSVTDIRTFQSKEIKTLQIDFKEGLYKGTISIVGEFILDRPGFKFTLEKNSKVTSKDIELLIKIYNEAYKPSEMREVRKKYIETLTVKPNQQQKSSIFQKLTLSENEYQKKIQDLQEMGIQVIEPDSKQLSEKSWEELGGYESQKRAIEDTILLSLTHQEIYDEITKRTRRKWERNKPKAVLFEGPPGTGKTTSAKIIASQVGIPLIYVPIEALLSKWYGKAEQNLSTVFDSAASLGKSIIFIDEIDALAVSRSDKETHEVSKRLVSILLRKIDSFESDNEVMLICATNRKDFLDPAMLSRLDLSIKFDLPDFEARKEIFKRYAMQFEEKDFEELAKKSNGFSGRGILEVCKDVERKWASKMIRQETEQYEPDLKEYINSINFRISTGLN